MRKKSKLTKWIKRFWDFVRKTKLIIILCCLVVVVVLMTIIMLKQRDIGAYEAGMQIEQLANMIRGHYKMRPDYWGLNTGEIIKNNLYPEDMSRFCRIAVLHDSLESCKRGSGVSGAARDLILSESGLCLFFRRMGRLERLAYPV